MKGTGRKISLMAITAPFEIMLSSPLVLPVLSLTTTTAVQVLDRLWGLPNYI